MKKAIILCSALLAGCASEFKIVESDVPSAVITAFNQKYPGVTNAEWEAEKEDGHLIFEAEFKKDGKEIEACFKPDGSFVKEE